MVSLGLVDLSQTRRSNKCFKLISILNRKFKLVTRGRSPEDKSVLHCSTSLKQSDDADDDADDDDDGDDDDDDDDDDP